MAKSAGSDLMAVWCILQELKGRFIVKGKRLDKLEEMFSEESKTAEEDSVTEEEDDEGDEEDQEKKSSVS